MPTRTHAELTDQLAVTVATQNPTWTPDRCVKEAAEYFDWQTLTALKRAGG